MRQAVLEAWGTSGYEFICQSCAFYGSIYDATAALSRYDYSKDYLQQVDKKYLANHINKTGN